jgi:Cytochrome c7 and related cytochrome c
VPASEVCMGCHAQIWNNSPLLESVRRSYFSGQPLPWNRVHDLGDFAYFDHAVHVQRGIGCVSCHGRVDQMARVEKVAPLTMQWCLDCHRSYESALLGHGAESPEALSVWLGAPPSGKEPEPAPGVSTDESGTSYEPMQGSTFEVHVENEIARAGAVTSLTTCSTCHR